MSTEVESLLITEEYLKTLDQQQLLELLLHRTQLLKSAAIAHIMDVEYVGTLKDDIKKIHDHLCKRPMR